MRYTRILLPALGILFIYLVFSLGTGAVKEGGAASGTPKSNSSTQPISTSSPPVIKKPANTTTTPKPTVKPPLTAKPQITSSPRIGTCPIFPASHAINTSIQKSKIHINSAKYVTSINSGRTTLNLGFEMPFNIVGKNQPKVQIRFNLYPKESDPGPYPIPNNAKIHMSADRHMSVIDKDNCKLYELYKADRDSLGWYAGNGAIFDLKSTKLRPDNWTSADAAGLPLYPLIIKYSEVKAGAVNHAIRLTVNRTQKAYIYPATHGTGSTNTSNPPMGLRLRLKANFDISNFPPQSKIILAAMKKYGVIVADIGTSWTIGGEDNPNWDRDDLKSLMSVPGSAFEAVETGPIFSFPKK